MECTLCPAVLRHIFSPVGVDSNWVILIKFIGIAAEQFRVYGIVIPIVEQKSTDLVLL